MRPHEEIGIGIINAWASHLNLMEAGKATGSPSRAFFTTGPSLFCNEQKGQKLDRKTMQENFIEQIDIEIQNRRDFDWKRVDLVFFPVCANDHFYLIVFWMKTQKVEIIDNRKLPEGVEPADKYGSVFYSLKECFEVYLAEKGLFQLATNVKHSQLKVLDLDWANSTNTNDCGIYLMRHMETYFGKKGKDWEVKISARSVKILQILRARYCETLITSAGNTKLLHVMGLAGDFIKQNRHRIIELNDKYKKMFSRRIKK